MIIRNRRSKKRWGAAAVETAFVMIPMTMLLFCIFEYCRFFMIWNLVKNAAREGCRYALVNNTSSTLTTDVTTIATNYLAGQSGALSGLAVSVSGTHNGVSTAVASLYP